MHDVITMPRLSAVQGTTGERIRWALDQRGRSAADLARHLGITRSAPSQWWSPKRNGGGPERDRMQEIADFLGCQVSWLLSGDGDWQRDGGHRPLDTVRVPVIGIAAAEIWREGTMQAVTSELVPCVPRSDSLEQWALVLQGTSADAAFLPGEVAICVNYVEARPGGPVDGDLVAVRKRRGTEVKWFIARLRFLDGIWGLHYESRDPRWHGEPPIRLPHLISQFTLIATQIDEHVEVMGHVFAAFRLLAAVSAV